jgi:hypothetical protein
MSVKNDEPLGPPEPEPPRREFRFKPPEFDVANRPVKATPTDAPIDVHQLHRLARPPPPTADAPAPAENEIHAILRANLARAEAKGEHELILEPRPPSRRKRDFWLLLIGGNLVVAGAVGGLHKNVITVVFGFSAMVFFSLGLIWVMWFVMDDY